MEWNDLESMMLELGQGLVGEKKGQIHTYRMGNDLMRLACSLDEYDENCDCVYHRVRFGESI